MYGVYGDFELVTAWLAPSRFVSFGASHRQYSIVVRSFPFLSPQPHVCMFASALCFRARLQLFSRR